MAVNYQLGDTIKYRCEGYIEDKLAVVESVLPNACIGVITLPQYSVPLRALIRNEDIVEVVKPN
jgi:hypothetical protein